MSLVIASAGSINHGSGATIDDIPVDGTCSVACWLYRTADGANQHIFTMDGATFSTRAGILVVTNDGAIRVLVRRATADDDYNAAAGTLALNTWTYLGVTFNDPAADNIDIYTGTLTTAAAEVSYGTVTNGSGAVTADSANDKWVGNLERANTLPFLGRIARLGYYSSALTLAEHQALQFGTITQWRRSDCVLLADYHGTGTQPDYSGNGNNGTVTSGTVADHAPLRNPWRRHIGEPVAYAVAAAASTQPPRSMHQFRMRAA